MSATGFTRLRVLEGQIPYEKAHQLQLDTVEQRKSGTIDDTLILLEHPPVITLGKNAAATGVVVSDEELNRRGIDVHRIERGGQATWHGPGQIVGYPIVDLHARRMGVARYVSNLEEVMIRSAALLGVPTERRDGMTGVFATGGNRGKVGAIGVRVSRGITYHGFAFNVDPDLTHYQLIVPCGMTETPVTSIAQLQGNSPSREAAQNAIVQSYADVFDTEVTQQL